jgi:MFS family permease
LLRRTFRAFESRDFRLVWAGACTSSIGTWMQKLAQSWLVLQLSGSPFLLGLDAFLGEIPILLFSLAGGVVADRADRRKLLIGSQIVQMCCAFLLAGMFALDMVRVWHILTLSFVVGMAQAFGGPAYQALIPSLVRPDELSAAIAWNAIQFNLARVVGPVLGGLALTQLGASWCFGLNGLSYFGPIVALLALGARRIPERTGETMLDSMKQGIRFIRTQPAMLSLIALAFVMTVLAIPMIVFLPVFARDVFHQGPSTYTLLLSVSGAGSVSGAAGGQPGAPETPGRRGAGHAGGAGRFHDRLLALAQPGLELRVPVPGRRLAGGHFFHPHRAGAGHRHRPDEGPRHVGVQRLFPRRHAHRQPGHRNPHADIRRAAGAGRQRRSAGRAGPVVFRQPPQARVDVAR